MKKPKKKKSKKAKDFNSGDREERYDVVSRGDNSYMTASTEKSKRD